MHCFVCIFGSVVIVTNCANESIVHNVACKYELNLIENKHVLLFSDVIASIHKNVTNMTTKMYKLCKKWPFMFVPMVNALLTLVKLSYIFATMLKLPLWLKRIRLFYYQRAYLSKNYRETVAQPRILELHVVWSWLDPQQK